MMGFEGAVCCPGSRVAMAMPMEEMEETEMEEILLIKLTKQMAHRSMPQIFIWRLILWVFVSIYFPPS